jgi:hypothetical protein
MTEPLDPETKRLRKLSPSELADEVGGLKGQIAALDERLGGLKAEGIRRGLDEADGALFHVTWTPPGVGKRIAGDLLRAVFGGAFVAHFSKEVATDWVMRCYARKAA